MTSAIGVFVLPNIGGMNACLKLASDLRDRGHHVYFLGLEDSEQHIRSNGFEFVSVFRKHFPKGYYAEHLMLDALPFGLGLFRAIKDIKARFRSFFEDTLNLGADEFLETLKVMKIDLVILASGDVYMEWPAILARAANIKSIYFHDGSYTCEEQGIPPHWTTYIPTGSLRSRVRIVLLWKWDKLKRTVTLSAYKAFNLDFGFSSFSRRLAQKYGHDLSVERVLRGKRIPRLVELIPCPPKFSLPGAREISGRYYIEPSIYLDIEEPVFPWAQIRADAQLVYCTMGTAVWFGKKRYRVFYQFVGDTAANMPGWDWVVATGHSLNVQELEHLPSNLVAVNYAPQVELLKRATIVICHGGTNTVKQCIYFGVPMIVFPVGVDSGADSPGNAARIVYHGLGVIGDWRKLNASYLEQLVRVVESSSFIRSQIKIMQREFINMESKRAGLELVETILQG